MSKLRVFPPHLLCVAVHMILQGVAAYSVTFVPEWATCHTLYVTKSYLGISTFEARLELLKLIFVFPRLIVPHLQIVVSSNN